MSNSTYMHLTSPWKAVIDTTRPQPRRFHTQLLADTLNYRMPARRRFGRALALATRRSVVRSSIARIASRGPRSPDELVDEARDRVAAHWDDVRTIHPWISPRPNSLSVLVLRRASADIMFLFGDEPYPLLVVKIPREGGAALAREEEVLRLLDEVSIAPRPAGRIDEMFVQEALRGRAFTVRPVSPRSAAELSWDRSHESVFARLRELGGATARDAGPSEGFSSLVTACAGAPGLTSGTRTVVRRTAEVVSTIDRVVVQHGDASAQNCMMQGSRVVGFVDWENATTAGVPGFDALNFALASVELGVGLTSWSEERVLRTFVAGWGRSGFWRSARAGARACALEAGIPGDLWPHLEVAFFARRVARRLDADTDHPTSARTATAMLEHVCAPS